MPPTITSAANPHIKRLRKLLTSAKARREEQLAIAEGIHLVESFLQTGATPDQYICAQSALEHPEVKALIEQLAQTTAQAIVVSNDIFSSLSSVHASVGIMIVFTPSQPAKFPETFTQTAVLLEDIQDPGNIGAILRVIAATGLRQVFLSPGRPEAKSGPPGGGGPCGAMGAWWLFFALRLRGATGMQQRHRLAARIAACCPSC